MLFIVYLATQFRMRGGAGEVAYLGAMHTVSVLSAVPAITVVGVYFISRAATPALRGRYGVTGAPYWQVSVIMPIATHDVRR